jgi:hypothetical protein
MELSGIELSNIIYYNIWTYLIFLHILQIYMKLKRINFPTALYACRLQFN